MDTLTTAQIHARLVEHKRIVANPRDVWDLLESRRAVKLYTAELARRQS